MSEKAYKTMTNTGAGSLALGIILLVTGLAAGILMVINGARLLKSSAGAVSGVPDLFHVFLRKLREDGGSCGVPV